MKKQEAQKFFLALLARIGDYSFIDIRKLDISRGYTPNNLADIDSFTMYFSKTEIIESIKRANLVSDKYLNGSLVIQDNQKHKPLDVIDKDYYNNFRIDLYIKEKLDNKQEANNIINKFRSISKDESTWNSFAFAVKNKNLDLIIDILFNLPYLSLRKFMIYLINERNKELAIEKNQELIRDKAA